MACNLLERTWREIEELDHDKLAVILQIAPIEEHGRHLPIGVDLYETEAWTDGAIAQAEQMLPDILFAKLPMIPFGYADMDFFPGNIHLPRDLFHQLCWHTIDAIARWGVRHIIVLSGHADPVHAVAIEEACDKVNRERGLVAVAPMGAIFGAELHCDAAAGRARNVCPNDFHAGWIETSCMLDLHPGLVLPEYASRPDILLEDRDMMRSQVVADAIRGEGHIGAPRLAERDIGQALNGGMSEEISLAICRFVLREGYERYLHHPLYPYLTGRQ